MLGLYFWLLVYIAMVFSFYGASWFAVPFFSRKQWW